MKHGNFNGLPSPTSVDRVVRPLFLNRSDQKRPLWTTDDVANYFVVSRRTVEDWVYRRKIPFLKVASLVRFIPDEVEKWALQ